jgi:demethylspheroidene O-methyltransferase
MTARGERWINWRNAMLANPRFQRFASAFPLTRPVAASRARGLFDVVAGFVYSQILLACIKLDLLEILRAGPVSVEVLAVHCVLPRESMLTLLKAAATLNLTESLADGRYALGSDGAALLGNPGVAEMVLHHRAFYEDLADPVALLRRGGGEGALAEFWPYGADDQSAIARYSSLMAASQPMIAGQVLDAVSFLDVCHLLDIGGGDGAFLEAVRARWPTLALSLFDLPPVAERARGRLEGGAAIFAGSFIDDPLPGGADMVSLIRVLHDHDDSVAQALLGKIRGILPSKGRLLIAEPMAGTRGAKAMGYGYFGMYLLAMGSGRPRTSQEIREMLRYAGFSSSREVRTRTPLSCRIILADA